MHRGSRDVPSSHPPFGDRDTVPNTDTEICKRRPLNGLKAVRRAGIKSGQDLLEFDHRRFWKKRLQFYEVDRGRLGRLIRNRRSSKRSRTTEMQQRGNWGMVDVDRKTVRPSYVHTVPFRN